MAMLADLKLGGTEVQGLKIKETDLFQYTDPVDNSVSGGSLQDFQGIRIMFEDGSRIIFRLFRDRRGRCHRAALPREVRAAVWGLGQASVRRRQAVGGHCIAGLEVARVHR